MMFNKHHYLNRTIHFYNKIKGFASVHPNDCEPSIYFDLMVIVTYYLRGGNR
jgi:hypothetical protein